MNQTRKNLRVLKKDAIDKIKNSNGADKYYWVYLEYERMEEAEWRALNWVLDFK